MTQTPPTFDPVAMKAAITGGGSQPAAVAAPKGIEPLAAAGVDLAKKTMAMITGGIVVILLLVGLSECSGQRAAQSAFDRHAMLVGSVSLQKPDPELRALATAIARSADDPKVLLPSNTTILLDRVMTSGVADSNQLKTLDLCKIPPAEAKARATAMKACAQTLDALTAADSAATQKVGFMAKAQEAVVTDRAATRAFWMQIAQLLLINLLLPILTALLGYIFGTQRSAG